MRITNYSFTLVRVLALVASLGALGGMIWLAAVSDAELPMRAFAVGFGLLLVVLAVAEARKAAWWAMPAPEGLAVRGVFASRAYAREHVIVLPRVHYYGLPMGTHTILCVFPRNQPMWKNVLLGPRWKLLVNSSDEEELLRVRREALT